MARILITDLQPEGLSFFEDPESLMGAATDLSEDELKRLAGGKHKKSSKSSKGKSSNSSRSSRSSRSRSYSYGCGSGTGGNPGNN